MSMYRYTPKGFQLVEQDDDDAPGYYVICLPGDTFDVANIEGDDPYYDLCDAVNEAAWLVFDGQDRVIWRLEKDRDAYKYATVYARSR